MANLWITQYAGFGSQSRNDFADEPNLGTIKIAAIDATNHVSAAALDPKTKFVVLYGDAQMAISLGVAPDATLDPTAFPIPTITRVPLAIAGVLTRLGTLKVAAATV